MSVYDLYMEPYHIFEDKSEFVKSDSIHPLDSDYLKGFLKNFMGINETPKEYLNKNFYSKYRKKEEQFFHEFLNSNPEKNFVKITFGEKVDMVEIKKYLKKLSDIVDQSCDLLTVEWLCGENKYDYILIQFDLPCQRQTLINGVIDKIRGNSKKIKRLSKKFKVKRFEFYGEEYDKI